jgi:ubiquinone/menaquinone biosynthesis C-methylase UbiE
MVSPMTAAQAAEENVAMNQLKQALNDDGDPPPAPANDRETAAEAKAIASTRATERTSPALIGGGQEHLKVKPAPFSSELIQETDVPSSPTLGQRPPRPILDAFFVPRGVLGHIGGWLMARGIPQQREVADVVAAWAPRQVCEVGCGPGVLGQLLAERSPEMRLDLVDPSPIMRAQAGRRCREAIARGRVGLHNGSADAPPFADEAFDAVVATNNVTMWPDLVAGLIEIRRVLRPDGRLVLSWHSVTAPGRTERRLALPDSDLDQVTKALEGTFGNAQRRVGKYSVIWESVKPGALRQDRPRLRMIGEVG